jgi:hypothetical protein
MKRMEVHCIDMYKDSVMKPTKGSLKGDGGEWEFNGESEFAPGTLNTCMKLSQ